MIFNFEFFLVSLQFLIFLLLLQKNIFSIFPLGFFFLILKKVRFFRLLISQGFKEWIRFAKL